jgi:hypothetical protein
MLESNQGLFRLRHWQSDALTTRIDHPHLARLEQQLQLHTTAAATICNSSRKNFLQLIATAAATICNSSRNYLNTTSAATIGNSSATIGNSSATIFNTS